MHKPSRALAGVVALLTATGLALAAGSNSPALRHRGDNVSGHSGTQGDTAAAKDKDNRHGRVSPSATQRAKAGRARRDRVMEQLRHPGDGAVQGRPAGHRSGRRRHGGGPCLRLRQPQAARPDRVRCRLARAARGGTDGQGRGGAVPAALRRPATPASTVCWPSAFATAPRTTSARRWPAARGAGRGDAVGAAAAPESRSGIPAAADADGDANRAGRGAHRRPAPGRPTW